MGVKTWSWYIPTTTSNFFLLFFKKIVSAEKGPWILIPLFLSTFIDGLTIFKSSLKLLILSQWGFNPVTAILGANLNVFL